jgi:circadian clock protein KaiB
MMNQEVPESRMEEQPDSSEQKEFVLRLYVGGSSDHAKQAVVSIKKICDENLRGRYELEVIDVYQQPQLAEQDKVLAAPTLVRRRPLPVRRLSGDLSDPERLRKLLGIHQAGASQLPAK